MQLGWASRNSCFHGLINCFLLTFPSFLKESCIWWDSGEVHKPSVQVEMEEMPALRRKVLETDVPELL